MYISIVIGYKLLKEVLMCDRCAKYDHSTSTNGYRKHEGTADFSMRYQMKNNKNISDFLGARR